MVCYLKIWISMLLVAVLAACGGGGNPGGTSSGGGSSSGGTIVASAITVTIVDANDVVIPSNSISSTTAYVKAVVRPATGVAYATKRITLSTDSAVATLAQTSVLTDVTGTAKVRISPVSLTSAAAATVTVLANIQNMTAIETVVGTVDYQTSAANVSLRQFAVSSGTITALQSTPVSVKVFINGTAAPSGQVSVSFSTLCGSFSPATAVSSSDGTVSSVYQSVAGCSGAVTLNAQASGAAAVTTSVNVTPAQAANLLFDSTSQVTIFTSRATSGVKQATLKFKVVDANGAALASQAVDLSLSTTAVDAGVTFAGGTTSVQRVSTDNSGLAAVTVSAGALPTPVVVTASLVSNPSVVASSLTLAVTSGVPTQLAASLAAEPLSLEAANTDGVTSNITFRIADRQGNPVPPSTAVTLVTSHGLIQGSCVLNSLSACSVTYVSQGARPSNGRVVVLAYLDGEESFVDANGNNVYDNNEVFADTGTVFRDDDEDGVHVSTEQLYPGGQVGGIACTHTIPNTPAPLSVANTCNNKWDDSIRVRKQLTLVMATSQAMVNLIASTSTKLNFTVSDLNGNSMADGTTVSAAPVATTCNIISPPGLQPTTIKNSTYKSVHSLPLSGCSGTKIMVTVTSLNGTSTLAEILVP